MSWRCCLLHHSSILHPEQQKTQVRPASRWILLVWCRLNSWIQTHQHTQWCSVTQQPSHEVKCESPRKRTVLNMYQWLSMCMHHSNRAYNTEETLQKTELTIAYKFPWVYCNYIIHRYGMSGGLSERRVRPMYITLCRVWYTRLFWQKPQFQAL